MDDNAAVCFVPKAVPERIFHQRLKNKTRDPAFKKILRNFYFHFYFILKPDFFNRSIILYVLDFLPQGGKVRI